MENYLHDIITYILSYFLPTVKKDLNLQKKLKIYEYEDLDMYDNEMIYKNFKNNLYYN